MSKYKSGMKTKRYPSQAGEFPAEIIGEKYEKNLNTGQVTRIIRVVVTCNDGKKWEEGFTPSLDPSIWR